MLEGKPCYGGLDGAWTTDMMAFRLTWLIDDILYTKGWRWVPEAAVAQRTERGTVPYAGWVEAGLIKRTPGDVIDYDLVEADILAITKRFTPKKIEYDSWNIRDLVNRLMKRGLPMEEFRQGAKSYHPAMQELERKYLAGKVRHGGDAVLNWSMANVVPRFDANLSMSPDKKRSPDKIDDACAFFMSVGAMGTLSEKPKSFQLFFV
jgi:phage terminase large subunit-like protein